MKCKNCGTEIENDSTFCTYCGTSISPRIQPKGKNQTGAIMLGIVFTRILMLFCSILYNKLERLSYEEDFDLEFLEKFANLLINIPICVVAGLIFVIIQLSNGKYEQKNIAIIIGIASMIEAVNYIGTDLWYFFMDMYHAVDILRMICTFLCVLQIVLGIFLQSIYLKHKHAR